MDEIWNGVEHWVTYPTSYERTVLPVLGFKTKIFFFFEQVLGLQVSGGTGDSAQPLTIAMTDQLTTQ